MHRPRITKKQQEELADYAKLQATAAEDAAKLVAKQLKLTELGVQFRNTKQSLVAQTTKTEAANAKVQELEVLLVEKDAELTKLTTEFKQARDAAADIKGKHKDEVKKHKDAFSNYKTSQRLKRSESGLPDRVTKNWLQTELLKKYEETTSAAAIRRHTLVPRGTYVSVCNEFDSLRKEHDGISTANAGLVADLEKVTSQLEQETARVGKLEQKYKAKAATIEAELTEQQMTVSEYAAKIRKLKTEVKSLQQGIMLENQILLSSSMGCGRGGGGLGSSGRGRMTPGSNSFVNGHQTFMINTPQGQMISPMQRRLGRVLQPQPENIPTTPVSQGLFNKFLMFKRMQKMASMSGQF